MRKALCVCGIVAVGAWFVTPTTGVIGVMRTIVVDLIGVAIGLMGVVGGWASEVMGARPITSRAKGLLLVVMSLGVGAWGRYNLVQIVRGAGNGPRIVNAGQCLVEVNNRDPGFADTVTLRTESGERLEATHYGPSFFDDDDFHQLGRCASGRPVRVTIWPRSGIILDVEPTGSPGGGWAAGKGLGRTFSMAWKWRQGHRLA